ncbi:hypothetical protein V9T40_007522 [Parthenolecanium corni]|uniref:Uncharacterized protein n=1 Tax=Parthenolecanium corni TaxID=536013 RepID=A0AAN9TH78_9HEMI
MKKCAYNEDGDDSEYVGHSRIANQRGALDKYDDRLSLDNRYKKAVQNDDAMAGAGAAADRRLGGHEMSEKPGAKMDTWREGRKTKGSRIRERPKRRAVVRLVRHEMPQQVAGSLYPSPVPTTRLLFGPRAAIVWVGRPFVIRQSGKCEKISAGDTGWPAAFDIRAANVRRRDGVGEIFQVYLRNLREMREGSEKKEHEKGQKSMVKTDCASSLNSSRRASLRVGENDRPLIFEYPSALRMKTAEWLPPTP